MMKHSDNNMNLVAYPSGCTDSHLVLYDKPKKAYVMGAIEDLGGMITGYIVRKPKPHDNEQIEIRPFNILLSKNTLTGIQTLFSDELLSDDFYLFPEDGLTEKDVRTYIGASIRHRFIDLESSLRILRQNFTVNVPEVLVVTCQYDEESGRVTFNSPLFSDTFTVEKVEFLSPHFEEVENLFIVANQLKCKCVFKPNNEEDIFDCMMAREFNTMFTDYADNGHSVVMEKQRKIINDGRYTYFPDEERIPMTREEFTSKYQYNRTESY